MSNRFTSRLSDNDDYKRDELIRKIETCRGAHDALRTGSFVLRYVYQRVYYGLNFRKFYPTRPEGAEALSPGQRPGLSCSQTWRPVRAKALKLTRKFIKLLPLQGALLTVTIPRALPWAKSFWAFSPYLSHIRKFNQ